MDPTFTVFCEDIGNSKASFEEDLRAVLTGSEVELPDPDPLVQSMLRDQPERRQLGLSFVDMGKDPQGGPEEYPYDSQSEPELDIEDEQKT
eukprot:5767289-Pyramimonas_sp.AAC.1